MTEDYINRLAELNRVFYSKLSGEFDKSRDRPWPGWDLLWKYFDENEFIPAAVLDAGCGNARFLEFLSGKVNDFTYLGIDSSRELLAIARRKYGNKNVRFRVVDLLKIQPLDEQSDLITLFAVLHHIPGFSNRLKVLDNLSRNLSPSGYLVFTGWNILQDSKLAAKVRPWSEAGIEPAGLEEGDLLLDWRKTGIYRYYHSFHDGEVRQMIAESGLKLVYEYKADGEAGHLNTYYVCQVD